jgi:hypothetical protein
MVANFSCRTVDPLLHRGEVKGEFEKTGCCVPTITGGVKVTSRQIV